MGLILIPGLFTWTVSRPGSAWAPTEAAARSAGASQARSVDLNVIYFLDPRYNPGLDLCPRRWTLALSETWISIQGTLADAPVAIGHSLCKHRVIKHQSKSRHGGDQDTAVFQNVAGVVQAGGNGFIPLDEGKTAQSRDGDASSIQ